MLHPRVKPQAPSLKSNQLIDGLEYVFNAFRPPGRRFYEAAPVIYWIAFVVTAIGLAFAVIAPVAIQLKASENPNSAPALLAMLATIFAVFGGPIVAGKKLDALRKQKAINSLTVEDKLALAQSMVDKANAISVDALASQSALNKGFAFGRTYPEMTRNIDNARLYVVGRAEDAGERILSADYDVQKAGFMIAFGACPETLFSGIKDLRKASEDHAAFVDSLVESAQYDAAKERLEAHIKAFKPSEATNSGQTAD